MEATKSITPSAVDSSPFLLLACAKVGIGDEAVIDHLVNFAPQSISFSSLALYPNDGNRRTSKTEAYPIHAACMNDTFPDSALRMLIEKYQSCNSSALQHCCLLDAGYMSVMNLYNVKAIQTTQGYPIHHYLSRKKNVNLDMVELLVKSFPAALKSKRGMSPIELALRNKADLSVFRYLLEKSGEDEGNALLNVLCTPNRAIHHDSIPFNIVQLIVKKFPRSLHSRDGFDRLPIHNLCANELIGWDEELDCQGSDFLKLLQLLIKNFPISVQAQSRPSKKDGEGALPLHLYLNRSGEYVKYQYDVVEFLVRAFPDALTRRDVYGSLPVQMVMCNQEHNIDVIKFILQESPLSSLQSVDTENRNILHLACSEVNANVELIRLLVKSCPEFTRQKDSGGNLPLSTFCQLCSEESEYDEEAVELKRLGILKFLIEDDPESVRVPDNDGSLPLHHALEYRRSLEFCRLLVQAFPESVKRRDSEGRFPIHIVCVQGDADKVRLLVEAEPDCVNMPIENEEYGGWLPIHLVAISEQKDTEEIVRCLLAHNCKGLDTPVDDEWDTGHLPLYLACHEKVTLPCIQMIYDANPKAILATTGDGGRIADSVSDNVQLLSFVEKQLEYVNKADDRRLLSTQDENGQLLLHRALLDSEVTLGTIKLLLTGYPHAVCVHDHKGTLPLHIASEFKDLDIVKELMENTGGDLLAVCDSTQDYPLHRACRGGHFDTVSYFINMSTVSVSSRNSDGKLPIELLAESESNKDSLAYVEALWQMIKAYPDIVG